jgi:hypothetical protein
MDTNDIVKIVCAILAIVLVVFAVKRHKGKKKEEEDF